ncbi:MAG UNVERIFIED_CONTAM: hypothetical protein LVR18_09570 [Planctomycetaceae bacterium]|jgi:hypothetical protein
MVLEISRRSLLRRQAGLVAGAGLASGLPQLSASAKAQGSSGFGRAKSVIFLYLHGGAPSQDMFYLKPKNQILPAYVNLPNPLNGAGETGTGAGFPGRRYAPLESRAIPQFDAGAVLNQRPNPPVVRGIPRMEDSQLIDGVTPSRLARRRNLLVPAGICATICDQPGIDPDSYVHDRLNRPRKVAQGGRTNLANSQLNKGIA